MNNSANKPNKHHFLPVFYLRQWTGGDDKKLVRFTRPYRNVVKPMRVHPDGAGYIERLYAVEGLPEEARRDLETEFLSPVDSRAADALRAMLDGKEFTAAQRLAWAGFMNTLLFRMPDDIARLKQNISQLMVSLLPGFERLYQAIPADLRKDEFSDVIFKGMEEQVAGKAIEAALRLMDNHDMVRGLAALEWSVLTTDQARHELLTSDRPVIHTNNLNHPEAHLLMPIGPRLLFVAVKDRKLIQKVRSAGQDKLVKAVNEFVVSNAATTVCARSDSQLQFVQNRMGRQTQASLLARLPELQETGVADFMRVWEAQVAMFADSIPERTKEVNLTFAEDVPQN